MVRPKANRKQLKAFVDESAAAWKAICGTHQPMNTILFSSITLAGILLGASSSQAQTASSTRNSLAFPPATANGLTSGEARDVSDAKPTGGTRGTAGAMSGTATGVQGGSGIGSTQNLGAGGSTGTSVGANGAVSGGTGGVASGGISSTNRNQPTEVVSPLKRNGASASSIKANAANATRAASNLRNAQNTQVSGFGSLERRRSSGDNINMLPSINSYSHSASFPRGGATIADSHGNDSHGATAHSVSTARVEKGTSWSWLGALGLAGLIPFLIPRRKHSDITVRSQTRIETR